MKLQAKFARRRLAFFPFLRGARIVWIPQRRDVREIGHGFLEQLEPFAGQQCLYTGETGEVPARASQAVNQASRDRIGHVGKNDWDGSSRLLKGQGARSPRREQ